ncbi:hypothetical protein BCR39DRAFT_539956 [Naematelia encephala]|uniref:Uncharacterized protein n=1 Tax=Naematelia encephala TaxID=71784 RepID=A0A1Y2AYC7_9TREE|nr:hypothetical protein BCR39DRAFT_539956 [Naematelia encephala]
MKTILRFRRLAVEGKSCHSQCTTSRGYAAAAALSVPEAAEASSSSSTSSTASSSSTLPLSSGSSTSSRSPPPPPPPQSRPSPTSIRNNGPVGSQPQSQARYDNGRNFSSRYPRNVGSSSSHASRSSAPTFEEKVLAELEDLISLRDRQHSDRIWVLYMSLPKATRQTLEPSLLQAVLRLVVPPGQFYPKEKRRPENEALSKKLDNRFRRIMSDINSSKHSGNQILEAFETFEDYSFAMQTLSQTGDARAVDAIAREVMLELGINSDSIDPTMDAEEALRRIDAGEDVGGQGKHFDRVLLYRLLASYAELRIAAPPQQRGHVAGERKRQNPFTLERQREIVVNLFNTVQTFEAGKGLSLLSARLFTGCLNLARIQFDKEKYGEMLNNIVEQTITKSYGLDTRYFTFKEDQQYLEFGKEALHLVLDWVGTRAGMTGTNQDRWKMISAFEILTTKQTKGTTRRIQDDEDDGDDEASYGPTSAENVDPDNGRMQGVDGSRNFFQSKNFRGRGPGMAIGGPSTAKTYVPRYRGLWPWSGQYSKALNSNDPLDSRIRLNGRIGELVSLDFLLISARASADPAAEPRLSFFNTYDPLRRIRRFGAFHSAPPTPDVAAAQLVSRSYDLKPDQPQTLVGELTYYVMLRHTVDWRDPSLALHVFRTWWLAAAQEQTRWIQDLLRTAYINKHNPGPDPNPPPTTDAGHLQVTSWMRQMVLPQIYFSPGMFVMIHWLYRELASDYHFRGGEFRVIHDLIRDSLERLRQEYVLMYGRQPPPLRSQTSTPKINSDRGDGENDQDAYNQNQNEDSNRNGDGDDRERVIHETGVTSPFSAWKINSGPPPPPYGFHPARYLATLEQTIISLDDLLVLSNEQWRVRNERRQRYRTALKARNAVGLVNPTGPRPKAEIPSSSSLAHKMEDEVRLGRN